MLLTPTRVSTFLQVGSDRVRMCLALLVQSCTILLIFQQTKKNIFVSCAAFVLTVSFFNNIQRHSLMHNGLKHLVHFISCSTRSLFPLDYKGGSDPYLFTALRWVHIILFNSFSSLQSILLVVQIHISSCCCLLVFEMCFWRIVIFYSC